MNNPYAPPAAKVGDLEDQKPEDFDYAGFWWRVLASIIDSILIGIITVPLIIAVSGLDSYTDPNRGLFGSPAEIFISYVLPIVAIVLFWKFKQATPGKMLLSIKIIDAKTHGPLSWGQCIGRYFAYILSGVCLLLGYLWVGWEPRKRGWHDMLAGTLVVRVYK
jgi:uncharacterized RDD family membrane protein YckC